MASQVVKGEPPQTLNYKTWVLRVSVHCICEGCKKKVKKIITQLPGVHSVDIDIRQQKVIVVGNVEADTLINKLVKSGKNAELWPQQPILKEKKPSVKSKNREKQQQLHHHHHQESQNNKEIPQLEVKKPSGDHEKKENNPLPVKIEALKQPPTNKSDDKIDDFDVNVEQKSKDNDGASDVAVESNSKDSAGDHQEKDQSKSEGKKLEDTPPPPVEAADSGIGGGEGGKSVNHVKKKKSKGQNGNPMSMSNGGGSSSSSIDKPAKMESGNHHNGGPPVSLMPANESPTRRPNYDDYTPHPHGSYHYGALPSASYGLSYNTSYPTNSYTTSYYAPSPPPNSYLYSYQGPQAHQPPPPLDSYPSQPLDSFEIFSDENPNGCLVM